MILKNKLTLIKTIKNNKKGQVETSLTRQGSEADSRKAVHKKRPSDTLKPLQLT